jgi:hypothetical protein
MAHQNEPKRSLRGDWSRSIWARDRPNRKMWIFWHHRTSLCPGFVRLRDGVVKLTVDRDALIIGIRNSRDCPRNRLTTAEGWHKK